MAQGRISQKQAVAFGYISQLLLQTVPGIRSEYVSVHGYRDWEANLKSKITSQIPTPAAQNEPPASAPPPAQPSPDYGDLLRRSRDMMAGKSPTDQDRRPILGERLPTGCAFAGQRSQRERGNSLEPQTTPDYADIFRPFSRHDGRQVRHHPRRPPRSQRPRSRTRVDESRSSEAPQRLLRPHRRPRPPPPRTSIKETPESPPNRHGSRTFPTAPAPVPSFAISAPATPSVAAFEAAAKAAIPAASPPSPSDSNAPSDQSPVPRPKQEMPVPGITLTRTGHTTAWYAPASWSGPRPDPFPSRKERLRRSLRTMSNSRQHQMQNRAFWHSPCNSRTMNTCTERLGGYQSKQLMI